MALWGRGLRGQEEEEEEEGELAFLSHKFEYLHPRMRCKMLFGCFQSDDDLPSSPGRTCFQANRPYTFIAVKPLETSFYVTLTG